MENSNKLSQTSQPDVTRLGTRMIAERACDLGSVDRVGLDRKRRGERQTRRGVRGEERKFKKGTLLVIDRDKVQPDPHCPHVGV